MWSSMKQLQNKFIIRKTLITTNHECSQDILPILFVSYRWSSIWNSNRKIYSLIQILLVISFKNWLRCILNQNPFGLNCICNRQWNNFGIFFIIRDGIKSKNEVWFFIRMNNYLKKIKRKKFLLKFCWEFYIKSWNSL